MSAIDERFQQLREAGKKAFIPFVTAGDPSLDMTTRVLRELAQAGASIAEVGVPYSDPIADGPVIQASYTRALDSGFRLRELWPAMAQCRADLGQMPLVSMISYSIIHRMGIDAFLDSAQGAGFSGAIVPDLLLEEGDTLRSAARQRDFSLIHLVTPTTDRDRMVRIAEASTGFLYFVSVTGITGERNELPAELLDQVAWLKARTELPVCVGFGISRPEHVRMLRPIADGVIVGSAIVRRLAEHADADTALGAVRQLAAELIEALEEDA
ncbi:MAG: tryptophan synthase subunit alpha [Planctomycetota bacterium]|nr:MAG: tryptophan synthase subunit alpha [Planctomycetota bacterium]